MNRKDELPPNQDRDGDHIPDDADTAEAIKDVLDAFKTKDAGKPTPEPARRPDSD